jgi:hypothetical protein
MVTSKSSSVLSSGGMNTPAGTGSLLEQKITDLKSGKCDERARAAAVYRGKGNVQRQLDSARQAFIETA